MKKIVLFLTLALSISAVASNTGLGDFNQKFLEANQLMEEKLWGESIDIWQELYSMNTTNGNVNYKLGYCYLQTPNDKLKSLDFLKTATSMEYAKKYDPFDPTEENAPVDATYYLGRAYHLNYEMDKAIETYNTLLSNISAKHRLTKMAKRQIEMCEEAKRQVAEPKNFVISNVGPVINGLTNEYSPVISLDESALFFTSRRVRADSSNSFLKALDTGEYKEDIYVSYKDQSGNWMEPELLNINTDSHAATISVSPDGQTLYIYYDDDGNGQIFESVLVGETWSSPELLGSDINSDGWETHASVSTDGSTLYFVSDREGGYGGRDVYRCVKLPNGEWSKALNMGPNINTEYEEDSPFISADGKTLYFGSEGHNSMGGFDVFFSTIGSDEQWSTPENIGYPVNTVEQDVFFVPTANQKRAYYSSRKEEGFGLKDIYVVDMPDAPVESDLAVLKGYIFAPEGEDLPEETYVLVTNNETGEVTEYRPRKRDGAYVAILPPCIAYHIEYIVGKEIVHEEFINVPCESAYNEIEKEIYLLPVNLYGEGEDRIVEDRVIVVNKSGIEEEEEEVAEIPENYDPEEPIIVEVTAEKAYFERFFVYDFTDFGKEEKLFTEFVDGVVALIKVNGSCEMVIESSASNVPSSRFENNVELTAWRNKATQDQIVKALKKHGYKKGKDYVFGNASKLVQGPKYANDAINKSKYEPWQYVKVTAE